MSHETGNSGNGLSLDRFGAIVDAYGGHPQRWPADERSAALNLLARSEEARALRTEAADLDDLLDCVATPAADSGLAARILGSLPAPMPPTTRTRSVRRYLLAAAAPLAAAAALTLWIVQPTMPPVSMQVAIEDLGEYDTPTDVLLDSLSFDITSSLPVLGCDASGLGCIESEADDDRESQVSNLRRSIA